MTKSQIFLIASMIILAHSFGYSDGVDRGRDAVTSTYLTKLEHLEEQRNVYSQACASDFMEMTMIYAEATHELIEMKCPAVYDLLMEGVEKLR